MIKDANLDQNHPVKEKKNVLCLIANVYRSIRK